MVIIPSLVLRKVFCVWVSWPSSRGWQRGPTGMDVADGVCHPPGQWMGWQDRNSPEDSSERGYPLWLARWRWRAVPRYLGVQTSAPTAAPAPLQDPAPHLQMWKCPCRETLTWEWTTFSRFILSPAISESCCLIWADFLPSRTSSLASDNSSSLAAWARSFPRSLCSTFPPFRSFPLSSLSWGSTCCRVQPTEQFPWKKVEQPGECSSPSRIPCPPHTALISFFLCCPLWPSRQAEPWLSGPISGGVITSGHLETRAVHLLFKGLQHYSQDFPGKFYTAGRVLRLQSPPPSAAGPFTPRQAICQPKKTCAFCYCPNSHAGSASRAGAQPGAQAETSVVPGPHHPLSTSWHHSSLSSHEQQQ